MQLIAIMAVLSLVNIVGLNAASEADLTRRGMENTDYRGAVEVEEVSTQAGGSLLEVIKR